MPTGTSGDKYSPPWRDIHHLSGSFLQALGASSTPIVSEQLKINDLARGPNTARFGGAEARNGDLLISTITSEQAVPHRAYKLFFYQISGPELKILSINSVKFTTKCNL